jgi:GxxExxY protein
MALRVLHGEVDLARSLLTSHVMTEVDRDPVVAAILKEAFRVHSELGPGLLESAYQTCFVHALLSAGLRVQQNVAVPVIFENVSLDCGYRLDLVVDFDIIVEVKAVERLMPIHTAQVLSICDWPVHVARSF